MRKIILIILILGLIPFSIAQNTGYAWDPKDKICTTFEKPIEQMGSIIVPSCESEWTLANFVNSQELFSDCQCQEINAQTCAPYVPSCPVEPIKKGLAKSYIYNLLGEKALLIDIYAIVALVLIVGLIFGQLSVKKELERAQYAYKQTYINFKNLEGRYLKLRGQKRTYEIPPIPKK